MGIPVKKKCMEELRDPKSIAFVKTYEVRGNYNFRPRDVEIKTFELVFSKEFQKGCENIEDMDWIAKHMAASNDVRMICKILEIEDTPIILEITKRRIQFSAAKQGSVRIYDIYLKKRRRA
ncbi:hypothetical protein FWH09_00740 [Candidatus Saccharibacteria bacterium]|nr:hypothetical protein [Candidatus Saccharibacteria bacterium]